MQDTTATTSPLQQPLEEEEGESKVDTTIEERQPKELTEEQELARKKRLAAAMEILTSEDIATGVNLESTSIFYYDEFLSTIHNCEKNGTRGCFSLKHEMMQPSVLSNRTNTTPPPLSSDPAKVYTEKTLPRGTLTQDALLRQNLERNGGNKRSSLRSFLGLGTTKTTQ